MLRGATLILVTCTVACCGGHGATGGGKATMFTTAWTFSADAPYHDGVLRYATLGDATSLVAGRILATATGVERWAPPRTAVELVGDDVIMTAVDGSDIRGLIVADATSGAIRREVTLTAADGRPTPVRQFNAGLSAGSGAFMHMQMGWATAFALADGKQLWATKVPGTGFYPVVAGPLVGLSGSDGLHAIDIATGAERWRAPFDGNDLAASPRGGFFVSRGERVIELDVDGRELRSVAGRFSAADGELLAVMDGKDAVVVDGAGAEVARISPRGADDYVAAPGLCGRAVVYFRRADQTVWWHPARGAEAPIVKLEARKGEIEGQPRTVGPTLTEPPRCVGGLVLIQDWGITAYRIPS